MTTAAAVVRPARVKPAWLAAAAVALLVSLLASVAFGAIGIPPLRVAAELLDHLPGVHLRSGLGTTDAAIVWQLRLPRVVLALLVGGMLAVAGASYQGVFRNPLADPYLLGVSGGAGLGVTLAIVWRLDVHAGPFEAAPLAAFVGALVGVGLTYLLAAVGTRLPSPPVLLLAGVAVEAFLTALQNYVQQRHQDNIRDVYTWLLGRLSTAGWHDVITVLPYMVVTSAVLLACRRRLDVLAVGDEEAGALGLHVVRTRLIVIVAASLATAAAVSVSGLIGFVGIVVPHTVRLLAGTSYRVIVPLSLLFGASFLAIADLLARTLLAPGEIPVGVVTAVVGAPFFALVLRTRRQVAL